MPVLIVICVLLAIALTLAVIKIVLLRRGFDELTENIEDQVSGKTQIPVTLTTSDSHARHTAEILNRELKNLDRERNEYLDGNRKVAEAVTGISHDIRTPLTAINSYLDLMADEKDEELKAQYLERIKSPSCIVTGIFAFCFAVIYHNFFQHRIFVCRRKKDISFYPWICDDSHTLFLQFFFCVGTAFVRTGNELS